MKKKSKVFMGMFVLSVVVVMTGCGTLKQAKESIEKYDSNSYSPKMDEGDKYNAYVDLFNVLSDELAEAENSYAERHMDEAGNFVSIDNKDALVFSDVGTSLVQQAIEKADKGLSAKPKMDIDEDVEALLTVLKKEVSVLEEIAIYYKEKDFLNDHDKKGKELNTKLVTAYKQVDEPIKKFYDNMRALMNETDKKDRIAYEKEGQKISLGMLQFIDVAEEANKLVSDSIAEDGTINLTTEKYTEVNTKVSKALDELKAVSDDPKAIEKEGFSISFDIDDFVGKASEFKTLSNTLSASFDDEEALIGMMEIMPNAYSELIDAYNKRAR